MDKLSRREFLALSITPFFVPATAAIAAASSHVDGLPVDPQSSDAPAAQPDEDFAVDYECPECDNWGALTCPACDGTGMWTEHSESAGLYQREAARALGHCAWCNEWGEVECPECEGGTRIFQSINPMKGGGEENAITN